jgi:hypothetical protein
LTATIKSNILSKDFFSFSDAPSPQPSSASSSAPSSPAHGVFEEMMMCDNDDDRLSEADRELLADMYRVVITGESGWEKVLDGEQQCRLLDVDITLGNEMK